MDQPITFTSPFASPLPGDWASIVVASSASPATYDGSGNYTGGTILEYVSVLYAGGNGATAALKIGTSAPYVHYVTIEYSAAEGLYANGPTNLLMDGVTIANNAATGVQMDGGTTVLQNSSLTTNGGAGVQQNGGTLTVQNTTVDHSTGTGIATTGNATVNVLSSTVQNSGGDGVNANGAYAVLTILTTTLQYNAGAGVYLTGCNQCWNWYRPNLTVQASTVSHNGRGVDFSTPYGALFSITASVISNTVQDNDGVGIHAGDYWWGGCCWSTSDSVLIRQLRHRQYRLGRHVRYPQRRSPGPQRHDFGNAEGIYLTRLSANETVQGNTIQNNQGLAVQLTGSGADTVVDNTIAGNAGGQGVGLYLQGDSQTTIQGNDIISNTASGGSADVIYLNVSSTTTFEDNTVADNTAAGSGIADGPTVMDVWGFPAMEQNNFADPTATYEIADGNASGTADLDATQCGGIPPTPPSSPPISTTSRSTSTRAS